jgi:nucleoside 2-deoxyribosyltransferase
VSLIYLAGPLDGLEIDGTAWYDDFDAVRPVSVVGFMPGRAYLGASMRMVGSSVEAANRAVIEASLGVLANLSGPGRALGTIREIEFARSRGKPVIAIGDLDVSLASHDLRVVPDLEGAVNVLMRDYITS